VLTDRVVGWTSSGDAIAVVSSTGRVTGLKPGVVTITATSEGVTGTAVIAVGVSSVVVTPNPTSVIVGQTRQLTAVARDAASAAIPGVSFQWGSAATGTATVDASGLVTGRAVGSVNISASVGSVSGSSAVTVTPPPVETVVVTSQGAPNVTVRQPLQLTATLKDAAGNVLTGRTVTWSSSAITRATVNAQGLVSTTLLSVKGPVTITATSEGKTGSLVVTVQ
jgi:uncharacterized protein YjdB